MKIARLAALCGVAPLLLVGCGGTDEKIGTKNDEVCENSLTSYKGDCLKLEQIDPSEGFQLHFGPKNYDDKAEVAKFVLKPGEETNTCMYMTSPNEELVYFYDYDSTVRPGTHHMIIFSTQDREKASNKPDGFLEECAAVPGAEWAFMVGAQNGIDPKGARISVPEEGKPLAQENIGMAMMLPPKTRLSYSVHFVNQGKEDILQESWANFKYKRPEEVTQPAATLWWIGGLGMNVPPRTKQIIEGECENTETTPRRLVTLTGHVHANTTRFSAYKIPKANPSERQLVYEVFDWAHADLFYYDSVNTNPTPDRTRRVPGALTGDLTLAPGDKILWECEVDNKLDKNLTFGNEAYTAEMCNVFGVSAPPPSKGGTSWDCYSYVKPAL
ncbi:MAG TPA: hypothetical protein VK524_16135 [Polyangiaceae bacterium]|nr:hypothetical protein [Polyangiaceae bacterium]